jgi:CheY-like chemotaxis protein
MINKADNRWQSSSANLTIPLSTSMLSIKQTTAEIQAIHLHFITMMNGYIDTFKWLQSATLKPTMKSFNVLDAMQIPLNTLRIISHGIKFNMKFTLDTRSYMIYSDIQWFQENLFALLTYCANYSEDDIVHVTIITREEQYSDMLLSSIQPLQQSQKSKKALLELVEEDEEKKAGMNYDEDDNEKDIDEESQITFAKKKKKRKGCFPFQTIKESRIFPLTRHSSYQQQSLPKNTPNVTIPSSEEESELGKKEENSNEYQNKNHHQQQQSNTRRVLYVELTSEGTLLTPAIMKERFRSFAYLYHPHDQQQSVHSLSSGDLDLSIVIHRVIALGGNYGIRNHPENKEGSVLWISFPIDGISLSTLTNPAAAPAVVASSSAAVSVSKQNKSFSSHYHTIPFPTTLTNNASRVTSPNSVPPDRSSADQPFNLSPSNPRPMSSSSTLYFDSPTNQLASFTNPQQLWKQTLEVTQNTDGQSTSFSQPIPSSTSTPVRSLHILVVEDAIVISKMITRALVSKGYTVDTADNGVMAIEKFRSSLLPAFKNIVTSHVPVKKSPQSDSNNNMNSSNLNSNMNSNMNSNPSLLLSSDIQPLKLSSYDVILMDTQMPKMDGYEAIEEIRSLERQILQELLMEDSQTILNNQLIIAMSANPDYQTALKTLKKGANDFLSKPFSLAAFEEIVNSFLD